MIDFGNGYWYFATPYSHPDERVREYRFEMACEGAARLLEAGINVYCPIAHTHPISEHLGNLPHEFWMRVDHPFLVDALGLIIGMLPGWSDSRGVMEEMRRTLDAEKPISYLPGPPFADTIELFATPELARASLEATT